MAYYHQLSLFDSEPYTSKLSSKDEKEQHKVTQLKSRLKKIEYKQLELNLSPEQLNSDYDSMADLIQAA